MGRFREDLFYRLCVVGIHLPPLRDRGDDVILLAEHIVRCLARRLGRATPALTASARVALRDYHWPGNVRELENEIERALVLSPAEKTLSAGMFSPRLERRMRFGNDGAVRDAPALRRATDTVEKRLIQEALAHTHGNRTHAARCLGLSRQGLLKKMKRLELGGCAP